MESKRRHATLSNFGGSPYDGLDFYLLSNEQNGSAPSFLASLPQIYSFPRDIKTLPEVPQMAECPKTWDFISRCIANCVSNHPDCNRKPSDATLVLPSRVLQLISDGKATIVRLVDLNPSTPVEYAALSYSWGHTPARPPLTTTRKNLDQMRRGIDVSQLPSTLRDAATVCSRLGINMLWIDSLCIIQDDANDWDKESQKMGDVYQNAFVTIISASTHSCHESFLSNMRQDSVALARSGPGDACIKARISVARGHHLRFNESYGEEVDPIDGRAWTLQERVLSNRAVIFTGAEVQWQCRASKTCECGLPSEETISELIRDQLAKANPGWDANMAWEIFLAEYTKRSLTMVKDRLPALSAIARKISTSIDSEYFAGLWSNSLVKGMCWAVFTGKPRRDTYFPTTYIAPSFSWASVVGPVRYKTYSAVQEPRWLARPVSQHIVHRTDDTFGGVSEAYVDLEALLLPARLCNVRGGQGFEMRIDCIPNVRGIEVQLDGPIKRITQKDGLSSSLRRFPTPPGGYQPGEEAFINTPIHFMPLCVDATFGLDTTITWCLLLGSVSDNAGYERLGNATVYVKSSISNFGILDKEKQIVRIF
ncbi:HET domain-containing protein [Fusarium sp. Ph1]|nr:HET domain-containing protein [Fusarium sp. Ph1]